MSFMLSYYKDSRQVTFTRPTNSAYSPSTGEITSSSAQYSARVIRKKQASNEMDAQTKAEIILYAINRQIKIGDRCNYDGINYRVGNVLPVGENSAVYYEVWLYS